MTKQNCISRIYTDYQTTKYLLVFTVKLPLQSYLNSSPSQLNRAQGKGYTENKGSKQ